ncbi:hypothetical protein PC128_g21482 [Phytophthora cactorum]|nr:hypothetical protein PC120_g19831 [Phytophthora cactorum]KAG3048310.1 hypothetical protein PC121_g19576 [Phytophthora cactorum]KAG3158569.1 hypothetical protein PC128_g21482 [Phytophthora cactorum]KAG4040004.1 hypothetical protein PC123_g24449 [Phytophthora cactorum]
MEAEYIAASVVQQELLEMRGVLKELEIGLVQPMELRVDNQATLVHLESEKASFKAKQIDVRIMFVMCYTKRGVLKPVYCESKLMPADLLMKVLAAPSLNGL